MDLFDLSDLPPKVLSYLFWLSTSMALCAGLGWLNEIMWRRAVSRLLHEILTSANTEAE